MGFRRVCAHLSEQALLVVGVGLVARDALGQRPHPRRDTLPDHLQTIAWVQTEFATLGPLADDPRFPDGAATVNVRNVRAEVPPRRDALECSWRITARLVTQITPSATRLRQQDSD